jgi:hypothetical protein
MDFFVYLATLFPQRPTKRNEKDMGLKLERGLELFSQVFLKQTLTHPVLVFSELLLYF